ncbi:aldehyde dehydrogenase family protein [Acidovorax sp. CCYZU-2555]|uniref:aldehyde dehydrogenase family protein n=1 Tax=Acidovorax sp. CCYZU-2555 TaxID=2835042 RepID=UPI001BCB0460|nr:aldehyde dehydrogenase family protein [Acidovorax sp. CCYZU-2555]MBS7777245.1 aldehyde dehydrogenase family protein [Acidovorax sp. CCYZU-2555]
MTASIPVRNPRTGQYDFQLVSTEPTALPALAQELRANQSHWESLGLEGRLEVLDAWRKVYLESYDEILAALVADTGRLGESQREMQRLPSSIDKLAIMAREAFKERSLHLRSMQSVQVSGGFSPFQLVGVISPWNFPLSSSLLDTIPALIAGCTAIVKPSEITPRFVEPLVRTLQKVPEMHAVLRYVQGDQHIGAALITQVDAVCFTGSVPTGQKVAEAAGRAFIPAFLELGGKDPAIVTASADIDKAAAALLAGATANAGQVCVSIERIYVAKPILDAFVQRLVEKAGALKIAHPTVNDGTLGPIILERQAHGINRHLEDAQSKGAKIECGGMVTQRDGGWYAPATVVTGVDHSMALMTEETFGPIMPVMPYDTVDEAVALANDSIYGLSGAVFAGSADEAMAIARRMQVGAVSINSTGLGTAAIGEGDVHEKNAFKRSGLAGSRLGYDSITRFMRKKAYLVQH